MRGVNGVVVRRARGAPADVVAALRAAAAALPRLALVDHRVEALVVPNPAVSDGRGGFGFGVFLRPAGSLGPRIVVAAGLADALQRDHGGTRAEAVRAVLHTFLHEFAHYEQWRSGRKLTERGVNVRATALMRALAAPGGGAG